VRVDPVPAARRVFIAANDAVELVNKRPVAIVLDLP
jgi:hypothetical protein